MYAWVIGVLIWVHIRLGSTYFPEPRRAVGSATSGGLTCEVVGNPSPELRQSCKPKP